MHIYVVLDHTQAIFSPATVSLAFNIIKRPRVMLDYIRWTAATNRWQEESINLYTPLIFSKIRRCSTNIGDSGEKTCTPNWGDWRLLPNQR